MDLYLIQTALKLALKYATPTDYERVYPTIRAALAELEQAPAVEPAQAEQSEESGDLMWATATMRDRERNRIGKIVDGLEQIKQEKLTAIKASDDEPAQAVDLNESEQYRIQMAAISAASFGYWKEHDSILPEYDTVPLRDVAKLYQKYDALYKAKPAQPGWLRAIDEALVMHDVGVANADDDYATAKDKLNKLLCVVQDIGAYFAKQESAQSAAEPVQWCNWCGYLVTESEHKGCIRAASTLLPAMSSDIRLLCREVLRENDTDGMADIAKQVLKLLEASND